MKKLISTTIALAMLLSLAACNAENGGSAGADASATAKTEAVKDEITKKEAEQETEPTKPSIEFVEPAAEDFEYEYDAAIKGLIITKYIGEAEAIRIPTELDGDPVVWFRINSSEVKHVEIPNSFTSISTKAFRYCENLESIVLPEKLEQKSLYGFPKSLKEIDIPTGIKYIGEDCFFKCSSLESVTIPDSVKIIFCSAFYGCKNLKDITIPSSVKVIADNAFRECESLKEVVLPDGIMLGDRVFKDCTNLRNIAIPDDAKKAVDSNNIFEGCNALTVTYKGKEYNYTNFYDLYKALPEEEEHEEDYYMD